MFTSNGLRQRQSAQFETLEPRALLTLLGNQVFPLDNPWNQKVNSASVASNSATLVENIGPTKPLHPDFGEGLLGGAAIGIPYNVVFGDHFIFFVSFYCEALIIFLQQYTGNLISIFQFKSNYSVAGS